MHSIPTSWKKTLITSAVLFITTTYILYHYASFTDLDISCYYATEGDILLSAEDIKPLENSVFFHETSCKGELEPRQACAIESVARIHPERHIYVLFSSPVTRKALKHAPLSILARFRNIRLARVHLFEYIDETVLDEAFVSKSLKRSEFPTQLATDILRLVTLSKFGGVYLDTDVLVVKRLDSLGKNWVVRESGYAINNAVLAFGRDELGRNLTAAIMKDLRENYHPSFWSYDGAGSLTRTLKKFCNTSDLLLMSAATCHGFQVHSHGMAFLYPVPWLKNKTYVMEDLPETAPKKAFTHYLWNKYASRHVVKPGSYFHNLARKHCPTTGKKFPDIFGVQENN